MRIGIVAAVLILYWPLLLVPALDGLPNDLSLRGHTFVASVDRWLLGAGGTITSPDPKAMIRKGFSARCRPSRTA
ncbi:hypothetical protein [Sphingomonas hankookensis]|uniref:hypothetical protein n=1 Tax=Sphingomonas hankookensis TaxID=563996 RepID=UPI003D30250C